METLCDKRSKTRSNDTIHLAILLKGNKILVEFGLSSLDRRGVPNYPSVILSKQEFEDIVRNSMEFQQKVERSDIDIHSQHYWLWYGRNRNIKFKSDHSVFELQVWFKYKFNSKVVSTYNNWIDVLDFIKFDKFMDRLDRYENNHTPMGALASRVF